MKLRARYTDPPPTVSPALGAAARTLHADLVTAEVVTAMSAVGVEAILLKGPSLAAALYSPGEFRAYGDSDLLVRDTDRVAAERVLERLGFAKYVPEDDLPLGPASHADLWRRAADDAHVDLHRVLWGTDADPRALWAALTRTTSALEVAGTRVRVLAGPALALHVALHAIQNGRRMPKSLNELARAVERFDRSEWRGAAALADELGAVPELANALRLVPKGRRLADDLGLHAPPSPELALRAQTPPPVADGVRRLAATRGLIPKCRLVARETVPSRRFMRAWSPLARRGPGGLALAYLGRPLWLVWRAPAALLAWRAATRSSVLGQAAVGAGAVDREPEHDERPCERDRG